MRPPVMAAAVAESCEAAPPVPVPGFERTELHAVATLVPGFSGKVLPGEPESAYAGAIETSIKPKAASADMVKRFILISAKYVVVEGEAIRSHGSRKHRTVRRSTRECQARPCRDRQAGALWPT